MTSVVALPRKHAALPVILAATWRSMRIIFRSPALLFSPVTQSLFFLLIYAGQLGNVGASYLGGSSFIAFLLPLILLTGVATGAGSAGTLVLGDLTSGYLDRLRLAHGTVTPFIIGPVVAALITVCAQMVLTVIGAVLIGYRPQSVSGIVGMLGVMLLLAVGVSVLSVAVAIRFTTAAATNLVPLVVFGLSFFTGVFATVDQLVGWLRAVAAVNPLTPVIELARQFESGSTLTSLPVGLAVLSLLALAGTGACALALNYVRKNR